MTSLTALLAILAISGSKALHAVVLTLLMYVITLSLATSTCFIRDYPAVARLLHVIPLLGISCMVCVELTFGVQSHMLATVCILLGVLPLVTMLVYHGSQRTETLSAAELPMRMVHVPAPTVSGSTDTTPASG
ncbi:hypothetical protein L210DRAFT_3574593 [Boletus edulis BED1]|uniref:Uncharacterized protein n=1 Tax=Boletus edulis BED1 TaxID=1328754 RepID=A0AAD4BCJ9_BOLED|nr:hypothetical protein L210DRAFT_3574593 [Boletus edulis BED1]